MLELVNKYLWFAAIMLIFGSGIYFTYLYKLVQFRFIKMIKYLLKKEKVPGITSKETLMMVLAGRIGVGSIAGVALAIYYGGPGTIFWMWITAFIGASNSFAETVLGILYKEPDKASYKGGPSFYIDKGLKKPLLAFIYSFIIILSYMGGFISIQSNTITKSFTSIFYVSPILIAGLLSLIIFFIIFGGVRRIASIATKLVPLMTLTYLSIALYCLIRNSYLLPNILISILKGAFNIKSFSTGFITTFVIGIQRGIFSNEAGIGTGAIASSSVQNNDPIKQGYIQMLGVYITTIIICTATAIIILTSPYGQLSLSNINGVEITQYAFQYHLGHYGAYFIFIIIFLFSFTTILTGYYNGEVSLKFIIKNINKYHVLLLKVITILVIFIGCLIKPSSIWLFIDILVSLQAIINIYALICLKSDVLLALKNG